jgi:hypothetical protein
LVREERGIFLDRLSRVDNLTVRHEAENQVWCLAGHIAVSIILNRPACDSRPRGLVGERIMSDEPIVDLTEEIGNKKPQRRMLLVFVCVIDCLILLVCFFAAISTVGSYHGKDTVFFCIIAVVVLALNIIAISVPSGPSYMALKYRRKCLEEEKRIKELQNP